MGLVDGRGRLFGRFNVIDAAAPLVAALLIVPTALYAGQLTHAWMTEIKIRELDRYTFVQGEPMRVTIVGRHMDLAAQASIGGHPAPIVDRPDARHLVIELPTDLKPGTYGLVLQHRQGNRAMINDLIKINPKPVIYDDVVVTTLCSMRETDSIIGGAIKLDPLQVRVVRSPQPGVKLVNVFFKAQLVLTGTLAEFFVDERQIAPGSIFYLQEYHLLGSVVSGPVPLRWPNTSSNGAS